MSRLCILYAMERVVKLLSETEYHARPHKDRAMHCCCAIHVDIFQFVKIRFPCCYAVIDKFIRGALQRRAGCRNKGVVNFNISAIPGV